MEREDSEFLTWLASRLVHRYGESENTDFVLRLQKIAEEAKQRENPSAPMRMQIMEMRKTSRGHIVRIECECRARFDSPSSHYEVRCPLGHTADLRPLLLEWWISGGI